MPFAELPDMQQVILTGSDAHMPSPYLDAAPRRPIQQGGDVRGRAAAIRKFLLKHDLRFCSNHFRFFFHVYILFLEAPNRPAIGYDQNTNQSTRSGNGTNASNRSPVRGPLRGSHRATEE